MLLPNIANNLISELKEVGINAYIWHLATTGSVYIRFENNLMGSIRLGDHDGREKLKYKFNIRTDIGSKYKTWKKDGDTWRYYVRAEKWKEIIPVLIERHKNIQTWGKGKYKYGIPKFKREEVNK